jgi:hypothetical protein
LESNLTLGTGQSELSSLGSTLKVIIKEVHVQQSLKHSTKVNDKMMHVILLMVRSVNPVQNVEKTVGTHEEDIVSGQVLNLTIPLQNNQLGQDGDGLEVDGKSPQEIHGLEDHTFLDQMGDQGHYGARRHGEFPVKEGILSLIVSGADGFFVFNGVDYESGGEDVKNFHAGVVVGVKCGEEVKVSSDEDEEVKLVGAHGDSCVMVVCCGGYRCCTVALVEIGMDGLVMKYLEGHVSFVFRISKTEKILSKIHRMKPSNGYRDGNDAMRLLHIIQIH